MLLVGTSGVTVEVERSLVLVLVVVDGFFFVLLLGPSSTDKIKMQ